MNLTDFSKISWDRLKRMAKNGTLGPHVEIEAALLLTKQKKIWFTCDAGKDNFLRQFKSQGFVVRRIVRRAFERWADRWVIFRKQDKALFLQMQRHFHLFPTVKEIGFHIGLGRILSYSENDIAHYIKHNYKKSEFESWQEFAKMRPECF